MINETAVDSSLESLFPANPPPFDVPWIKELQAELAGASSPQPGDARARLEQIQSEPDAPNENNIARVMLILGDVDVLWLRPDEIDLECNDPHLALARAIVAIESRRAALLTTVVARCLKNLAKDSSAASRWIEPILRDEVGQCLLVKAFAAVEDPWNDRSARLNLFGLLPRFTDVTWPGPINALWELLDLLSGRCSDRITKLAASVEAWPGWSDPSVWPIRPPSGGILGLKRRLTDRAAEALDVGDARLWKWKPEFEQGVNSWPPLRDFFWDAPSAPRSESRS